MDETQLERVLHRYADQLSSEELQAAIPPQLRERMDEYVCRGSRRSSRFVRLGAWGLGIAACVAVVAFLLTRAEPGITFKRLDISARGAVRGHPAEAANYRLALELNRPAYVYVIAIDAVQKPHPVPLDDDGVAFTRWLDRANIDIAGAPGTEDSLAAQRRAVLAIAFEAAPPEVDELLQFVRERSTPEVGLETLARELESRFKCTAASTHIP